MKRRSYKKLWVNLLSNRNVKLASAVRIVLHKTQQILSQTFNNSYVM
jgi:hypothetical protein